MTYNLAIQACSGQPGSKLRAAQLDQAFQILTHMRTAGVQPCPQTITSLFALCARAGQGRRALALYKVRAGRLFQTLYSPPPNSGFLLYETLNSP